MKTKLYRIINLYFDNKGFSLVELMVVVGIVGILAAIAIPNYQKFLRKSKQTEAKAMLGGLYTSQTSFIIEWRYGTQNIRQTGFSPDGSIVYLAGFANGTAEPTGSDPNQTTRSSLPSAYRGPVVSNVNDYNSHLLCGGGDGTGSGVVGCSVAPGANTDADDSTKDYDNDALDHAAIKSCIADDPGTSCKADCTVKSGTGSCAWELDTGVDNSNINRPTFVIGAIGNIGGTRSDVWTINSSKEIINNQEGIE